jgi:hypothetical protein
MDFRWPSMRPLRRVLLPITVALALLGTSPAALAASYDFVYGPSPGGGYGHTQGTLGFTGARGFNYSTYLEDVCPADGYGVSFYFALDMVGAGLPALTGVKGWNTGGCGTGYAHWRGTVSRQKAIKRVEVISCWTDDGDMCWAIDNDALSTWKDNPST